MTQISIDPRDLHCVWVPPTRTDHRVPTAEELEANENLTLSAIQKVQTFERGSGLLNRPVFTSAPDRGVVIPQGLLPFAPGIPTLEAIAFNTTIQLPALLNTIDTVSRYDYVYLLCCGAIVDSVHDPDLLISFDFGTPGTPTQTAPLQVVNAENTQRLRACWILVASQGETDLTAIRAALTTAEVLQITVNRSISGISKGTLQFYPLDTTLNNAATYKLAAPTMILLPLLRVWRVQRLAQEGFVWGHNGEVGQFESFHIQPTYRFVGAGWDDWWARASETLNRIFTGRSLTSSATESRAVYNLINGQNAVNLSAPGIATASPNGSTALANGQRQIFISQTITQTNTVRQVVTIDDGSGLALASVPFQGNAPNGSRFSPETSDHKVYKLSGDEISGDGVFLGLGSTGALNWVDRSGAVQIGETLIVQFALTLPSGSGFPSSGVIEKVFFNSNAINSANIHEASVDEPENFLLPASGEVHRVVMGRERCGIHRFYKLYTVNSDSTGVLIAPIDAGGSIAFIQGANAPAGRIDKPILTGLNVSTPYQVLCHYAPKATETWQFQVRQVRYSGVNDRTWLNGSTIKSEPIVYAHSHGGASGYFLADGDVQFLPVALHLPSNTLVNAVKPHQLDYRILFLGESVATGVNSFRQTVAIAAPGKTLPKVGMILSAIAGSSAQGRGISCRLQSEIGLRLGVSKLPIQCKQRYQLVIAFLVEKAGVTRLAIATFNEGVLDEVTPLDFDSDAPFFCAIDIFNLY